MPDTALPAPSCRGLADILASVGDKWTILVVGALFQRALRYNAIQRQVNGISQRMLTLTLKRLETDGIVSRTVYPSKPPHVEYALTELGRSLRTALVPLAIWASSHQESITRNRQQRA
ncbi:winged helix-turn-helix transcriptional regulator [Frateuria aurantia]